MAAAAVGFSDSHLAPVGRPPVAPPGFRAAAAVIRPRLLRGVALRQRDLLGGMLLTAASAPQAIHVRDLKRVELRTGSVQEELHRNEATLDRIYGQAELFEHRELQQIGVHRFSEAPGRASSLR